MDETIILVSALGRGEMAFLRKLRTKLGLRKPGPLEVWPYPGVTIGRHSYGIDPKSLFGYDQSTRLTVGSFCSIAGEVLFLLRANHNTHTASTFPLATFAKGMSELTSKGPIVIGHDVWIGRRAMIMSGIKIGNGAVVAAGAIVTRDVPPYAIVGGNPAKLIRYRFGPKVIDRLQLIDWWHWPDEKIKANVDLFRLPAEEFAQRILDIDGGVPHHINQLTT